MTFTPDELVFRARALAQAHPFTPRAQAFLRDTIADETRDQGVEQMGIWAGYALTVGYCLRRVEENDAGTSPAPIDGLPGDLGAASDAISEAIRNGDAEGLLAYDEPTIVAALDRVIAGEIERRLSDGREVLDGTTFASLEGYIAWWVVKGYALRIAEQL